VNQSGLTELSQGTSKVVGRQLQEGTFSIMATDENGNTSGGMSVREAGKRGGDRVKAKYGSEFYEAIGRKGGEATKTKYGPSFYEEIGQKGGQKMKRPAGEVAK
jgi:general stress protein YciG